VFIHGKQVTYGGGKVAVNPDDVIELFGGSFQANPVMGRRALLVHFRGEPEYGLIVEDETGDYIIVETEDSNYVIVEFEYN
jgi:hypothetical protein